MILRQKELKTNYLKSNCFEKTEEGGQKKLKNKIAHNYHT